MKNTNMNYRDKNASIGGVVASIPQAAQLFREVGIDFCCGGHRLLTEVMKEQAIDEETLYASLEHAVNERKSGYQNNDFNAMNPDVLSSYIEDTHHNYLRQSLPEASELLNTVLRVHGKNHPELFSIYRLFGQLKAELEQHLIKEETILFPILSEADVNREEIITVTEEIITEHEAAGEVLRELRRMTGDYQAPADACGTFRRIYELMEEIEKDLHQHIHLENNILLNEYANR